jgi:hypothetical protein
VKKRVGFEMINTIRPTRRPKARNGALRSQRRICSQRSFFTRHAYDSV